MKILGIDYGRAKIGIAVGVNGFSEPLKVIRVENFVDAVSKIKKLIEIENPEKVVVGVSEGVMGEESKKFQSAINNHQSAIVFDSFDETLSSQDAQRLSQEAGIPQKKRHEMEDAYAASIMLQNYLDSGK